jgi:DNA recombination protein RmuC
VSRRRRSATLSVVAGTIPDMDGWMWGLLGVVVGAGAALGLARLVFSARSAALATERDLLRERVVDLEGSLAEDLETAALLAPLKETLGRVEGHVTELERDRVQQFGSLRAVLARVEDETKSLGRATASLAGSLRSSTVRGAWGEVQLRRVLEAAGMLARCDFDEQVAAVSAHGRGVRPDVVVRLPGDRHLVIDAKVPMDAFLDAQADDLGGDERAALLAQHATRLAAHVESLAAKEYWSAFRDSPQMVVCFVPSDATLAAALAARPSLHESALARRVVLVGPGSLLALLRTVAHAWQQDALSGSARELLELGQELYRRLSTLGAHAAKMGRSLQSSVESYNALVGALESRVLVTARRMNDLDLAPGEIETLRPVETGPRPLTAHELIDAVAGADARPELLLDIEDEARGRDAG